MMSPLPSKKIDPSVGVAVEKAASSTWSRWSVVPTTCHELSTERPKLGCDRSMRFYWSSDSASW